MFTLQLRHGVHGEMDDKPFRRGYPNGAADGIARLRPSLGSGQRASERSLDGLGSGNQVPPNRSELPAIG